MWHVCKVSQNNICCLRGYNIAPDKLETLSSSPLSFMLRSAMRLPQGFRRVPRHQHKAENSNRTDQSEHKAIVCMLGNRIHVCSSFAPNLVQRLDQTTD